MTVTNPRVFTRTVTAPAALPWDQRRIALLDAEAGSPSPLDLVYIQVRRLDIWRPGRAGEFLIAYARRIDIPWTLAASAVVGGRTRHLKFETPAARKDGRQKLTIALCSAGVAVAVIIGAAVWAIEQRRSDDAYLANLEARAHAQARLRRTILDADRNTALIAEAGLSSSSLSIAISDLEMVARLRDPSVRVTSVEWTPNDLVVETQGPSAPIPNRRLTDDRASSGAHRWILRRGDLTTTENGR